MKKQELIDGLRSVFSEWERLLAGCTEEEITTRPGTRDWSIAEVVTHLAAWLQVSTARLEAALHQADPHYPAWLDGFDPFYAEDHVNAFNARIRESHSGESWTSRYGGWKAGVARFLDLAKAIPESTLFEPARYSWLRGNALSAVLEGAHEHHREHLDNVRARSGDERAKSR